MYSPAPANSRVLNYFIFEVVVFYFESNVALGVSITLLRATCGSQTYLNDKILNKSVF